MVRAGVLLGAAVIALLLGACSGGRESAGTSPAAVDGGAEVAVPLTVVHSLQLRPTATPHPTFTPAPTALPSNGGDSGLVNRPGVPAEFSLPAAGIPPPATVAPTVAPTPTATPSPAPEGDAAVATATAEPPPTPYGALDAGESVPPVSLLRQTVFPMQGRELEESFLTGQVHDLPPGAEFISTQTRFVGWMAAYDTLSAPFDWTFEGYVRWYDITEGRDPYVMYEAPVELHRGRVMLFQALGDDTAGWWRRGLYRVSLLDGEFTEVAGWTFEVR